MLPAEGLVVSEGEIFGHARQLPFHILEKRIGAQELPLLSGPDSGSASVHPSLWAQAVLTGKPYPVKALITSARNQVVGDQNSRMISTAMIARIFFRNINCG